MKPLTVGILISVVALSAQIPAVPVQREPHHHLVLQNQYTRVYRVEIAPHQSTLLHHHARAYITIVLGAAEIQNAIEGKPPTTAKLGDGEAQYAAGNFSHVITDIGNAPFRNITLEILKKPATKATPERGLEIGHGGLTDIVIDNAAVRVIDTQIAPGGMLHKHRHLGPHLMVAVTNLELHDMPEGQPAVMFHQNAGDVKWFPAGVTHELMNMGQQQARFIVIEFK